MLKLNLPAYDYDLRKWDEQLYIYDSLRQKYLVLTQEEWVRQHFIHYLIHHKNMPRMLLKEEALLSYNQLQKRADILVYSRAGNPLLLVECKAPTVNLANEAIFQILTYNARLKVPYLALTNGIEHCYAFVSQGSFEWLEHLPDFKELVE